MTDWPSDAPSAHEHDYRIYWASDADTEAIAQGFKERYGQPPDWMIEQWPWLYVGPIPPVKPGQLEALT